MNQIKKIAKWGLLLLLTLIGLLVGVGLLFEEQIVKQLLVQLNENLTQPVEIEEASLSLISDFPNASISLRNVQVKDHNDSLLLQAEDVRFSFGIFDLLNNALVFDGIHISNGELHLRIDEKGFPNYDILKTSDANGASSASIVLQEALLSNVRLTYTNKKLAQQLSQQVKEAKFSGSFAEKEFALRSKALCFSDSIQLNGKTFLSALNWGYEAALYVDRTNKKLELTNASLRIEESEFKGEGNVQTHDQGQEFDLHFTGDNFDLGTVLKVVSDADLYNLNDLYCEGQLRLTATIKGRYSKNQFPELQGNIELENGELDHPKLYYPIEDASLTAHFTNAERNATGPTVFEISKLKGYVDKMPVEVFFRLENIENPYIDFVADGELPLVEIANLLPGSPIDKPRGSLIFRTLKFSGLASQMADAQSWGNIVMKGELECNKLKFEYHETGIEVPKGYFEFDDEKASLHELLLIMDNSDVSISGTAENLLPVVFSGLSGRSSGTGSIGFNVSIESEKLDVQKLLNTLLGEEPQTDDDPPDSNEIHSDALVNLGNKLNGSITAEIQHFSYQEIEGNNFSGSLQFNNNTFTIHGAADAMNGHCQFESSIRLQSEPKISAKVLFQNIDMKTLFEQGNNLGQDFVRSEHLGGTLNSGVLIYGSWDSLLNFNTNDLHILAGVKIDDGYLRNFDLLESFSNYVEIDDLRNVRFATLYNWLEYRENTFILPTMFVQNNAMNLTVCGSQTYDGAIDYNFKINGSQVLEKKFSAKKFKGKLLPAKKDGFFNLYINLHGTVENYDYSLSKNKVKTALSNSEYDRKRIRRIIFDAFGSKTAAFTSDNEAAEFGLDEEFSDKDETEYIEGF